jgi:hypothetical protein
MLDSGLFVHAFDDDADRTAHLDRRRSVLPPGGRYFMLCFRDLPGGTGGLTPRPDCRRLRRRVAGRIDRAGRPRQRHRDGIRTWLARLART